MRVDEATWTEFRQAIGDRSVAEVLGGYVELEVARARRARVQRGDVTQRELVDALERARVTAAALDCIRQRLEVMARSPASPATATGADGDAERDGGP